MRFEGVDRALNQPRSSPSPDARWTISIERRYLILANLAQ